ncbi:MAG: chromosomal replication initiator protein DnaA [Candidatus Alcyoniella australis]|nr:chromosomal replication initiator protein DnaA [Candidatus Alcyoniella australis]
MKTVWTETAQLLRSRVPAQAWSAWVEPVEFVDAEESSMTLEVPSKYAKEVFLEKYISITKEALHELTGRHYQLKFMINEAKGKAQLSLLNDETTPPVDRRHRAKRNERKKLNAQFSFSQFIVGPSNQFCYAACNSVANNPGRSYNPLFIYGGVGLGKTHILNAIGNHVMRKWSDMRVLYITAETFMNEMIMSLQHNRIQAFRNKFRNGCDVLLIDDIQFLTGKERTQEEFFHTFNSLYETERQIVMTSDKFPKDIPGLEERLRSRFEWGLIADIAPPELETRIAILIAKAKKERADLPDDVALFLASNFRNNIRELEGAYIRAHAFASLSGKQLTVELAREVLKHMIRDKNHRPTIEDIQKTVADYYHVKVHDLRGHRKPKIIAHPRQVAMYLSRKITEASYPEIGQRFGGKDHSTVIHAVNRIVKKMQEDINLSGEIDSLLKTLSKG